ncbi:5'/3'-nucleotidase SurE [Chloroflexota bacterium]
MHILVTNDDGILSDGLWALARELKNIARVTVVAPDRQQSGIGTAVTLRQPLRIQKTQPAVPGVDAYSTDGTPSDSVILGLGKLARGKVDVVVSGINQGSNLGEDVHISGTVGAALQGYFRSFPSIAISAPRESTRCLDTAARVAAILAEKLGTTSLPTKTFLNVNVPDLPPAEINGVKITRLARESHINTVEESNHETQKYYWLMRERVCEAIDDSTDIWAIDQGNISITPLYTTHSDRPPGHILDNLCSGLLEQLRNGQG